MLKRTIYIGNSTYLKLKDNQLKIEDPLTKEVKGSVPIEDLGFLVLDHYQITLSHQLIIALQQNNVAIISCDESHLPLGLMLPMNGHVEYSERLRNQINCSEPLRKQLWKQTVEAKIYQQKEVLRKSKLPFEPMITYMNDIKSGDSTNMEGIAAQHYWKYLFDDFTRERKGDAPNNFLNFGYAILRSMVARALVSSGLNPTIGIFHKNKYNAYCLADDIMEPYRPYVDLLVVDWLEQTDSYVLDKSAKAHLLQLATYDVYINGLQRPLITALSITTSSLCKCFMGESRVIHYPMIK
ncbi:type II CRISPR-associated endonuclease Cas1 [Myroides odoratus]|uniref:CRISPR-associated endonuclease Cas1 n=1 Tax=Myroides odoratus TaxID=256 RepID=A0A9Q7E6S2_MYROD|nr:type II CRISPR-associated endonuclease Cas1 [Myroides odoratus]EHQ41124.1 CRISPR-associated protein Cas1 [Myroides odoratus DSM 2801]EKB08424.1 CRISPR-associated endonuclease cas1, subtype II/nmeni [Myroides odoratus CIP 103059]QQT98575.1 type II CRISPR-associated endonuclease Cas1 [Myroides odoratus]WQD59251.1 type II CRISPR-associated endonuclease Cas1 [Myroides odoratus]STZ32159.1 CRISPR-associated endonuclease Cas1, subtype II/NMENI [Myroides odoratus]